ncbi:3-oxoacid CoA-transferase subunit A/3-oxoadipate CoA-transferase, alpha subunit [Alteribacillus persepolensis]|uniref:3-oxoacid CoA-transferase subunit A/3-oxoadipate CoA-transferase, alpha subunit n=1 Tax=Alteribacillus persepolensis TaxID=568899 RepID=A0A1G8B4U6_9BACI|nr:CoA transferase subunit A [Alteribacillus persepolensis]SDH28188.1 3-oxoacid CoA-transferase subunit A/3-oxoadipate CoA-transferase, alpha subunit [Alteribacillus persepolensis]
MTVSIINDALREITRVQTGDTVMVGGFGLVGSPLTLIDALTKHDASELTIISNNVGETGKGLGILLQQGKLKKAVGSYFTSNREVAQWYNEGKLELELLPQGTFSEAIRAGGAGIGGFYTKTAVGTDLAKGKETKDIDGETYLLEKALKADVALVRAWKADTKGNLVYYKTARNFNPIMASAAKYVIAEVDEIVEEGELSPEEIATPHLYVDSLIKSQLILTKEGVIDRE